LRFFHFVDFVGSVRSLKSARKACAAAISLISGFANPFLIGYDLVPVTRQEHGPMDEISKFSRFVRIQDPAIQAWRKVLEAGEDDGAYEAAVVEFEKAVPTTPRGLTLKLKLLWQRLGAILQGDRLTPSGRQMMRSFRKTINDAIEHLAKQGRYAGFRW
jgi:hypothetical protein